MCMFVCLEVGRGCLGGISGCAKSIFLALYLGLLLRVPGGSMCDIEPESVVCKANSLSSVPSF